MLIELSGIDGSGKSTVARHVAAHVAARGYEPLPLVLRSVGKRALDAVAMTCGHEEWTDMFPPDEVEIAHAVEMAGEVRATLSPLDRRRWAAISDTYVMRWLATAALKGVTDLHRLAAIYATLPRPDLSIHLDLSPEEALRRINGRPKGDRILGPRALDRLARYRSAFAAAEPVAFYPRHTVETSGDEAGTIQSVLAHIDGVLDSR